VENVAALLDRGMADVLGTLSDLGYDAEWDTVSACSVGHTHVRRRVFIVAHSDRFDGRERLRHSLARAFRTLQAGDGFARARACELARLANPSELYGGADGLPDGMERNHAIGNAVAPAVVQVIGEAIMNSVSAGKRTEI
jgi:DNA (cytosine-5)-methyltransferase 1